MNEIQDVKEVLDQDRFAERTSEDPKRIYGFLLCTDEHEDFRSHIQKAWRTLDALSGKSCDVFTLEKWQMPYERFESRLYLPVDGGSAGQARIADGDEYGYPGQHIAIDNGIMLPDRTECLKVRDQLFENPKDVILPGFAIFPSVHECRARFYKCGGLGRSDLSELFQIVLTTIRESYNRGNNGGDVFDRFVAAERSRKFRRYVLNLLLRLSLMDLIRLLGHGFKLVTPKSRTDND